MNQATGLRRWLAWALAVVVVVGCGLAVRGRLSEWTERQLRERQVQRIQALPEAQAAALVRQLFQLDQQAPAVLVPLVVDQRAGVSDAAAFAIDRLVTDWSRLNRDEATPRIVMLASELAAVAPKLPAERRRWAHALATRLVVWPLDDSVVSGQVVADCETVLRLPADDETADDRDAVRVAAAARTIEPDAVEVAAPQPPAHELPGTLPAVASPESEPTIPRVYGTVEPGRLPDASQERPVRPKQFLPPRAMKIDG
jgi:hypothetical protein